MAKRAHHVVVVGAATIPLLLIAAACTSGDAASPTNNSSVTSATPLEVTTFHKDVEPILQRVCQRCHLDGGIAPFALATFLEAKNFADTIVTETQAKRMPPWGAQNTSECTPPLGWQDDLRLSDVEIGVLAKWHTQGDLEGNPADAPPPVTNRPLKPELAGSLKIAPAKPFTLAETTDTMQCFLLDPQITQKGMYLNGTFFVPGNPTIVHHAIAFTIPPTATTASGVTDSDPKIPLDANTPYECFGGPRVDGANIVAAWAPGSVPVDYPASAGLPIVPGTRFVMQVHYHPHANATPNPDTTQFQYRLTSAIPDWIAIPQLIGNFNGPPTPSLPAGLLPDPQDPTDVKFRIPANATAHVETMTFTLPETIQGFPTPSLQIAGLGAHMHLAGHDEKVTLKPKDRKPDGSTDVCLLQEPAWNFDWQRSYGYDAPIAKLPTLNAGDSIDIRCTYNNTMDNPKLASALNEARQPIHDIFLGESTTDEMCLAGFMFLRPFILGYDNK